MIYGNTQLVILNDTTDLIGIRTLVLSKLWQPSTSGMSMEDLDAEKPPVPIVSNMMMLVGEQTRQTEGGMRTNWTFQGANSDGNNVVFKDRNNSLDYGFTPGFAQVPIQRHPKFQTLITKYGGMPDNDGQNVIWPPNSPDGTNDPWAKSYSATKNPMFGVNDYFRIEGTYRFRYASEDILPNVLAMAGHVFTSGVPGTPPTLIEDRNWLCLAPSYRRRGMIYDITEEYWLSAPGGWPEPVYGAASDSNSPNSSNP